MSTSNRLFIALACAVSLLTASCGHSAKSDSAIGSATTAPSPPTLVEKATVSSSCKKYTRHIGVFIGADTPGNGDQPYANLDAAQAAGFDVVLNYSILEGTPVAVQAYINHAHHDCLKVIIPLHAFWPDIADSTLATTYTQQWGGGGFDAETAAVVKATQASPAVWGFVISDEKPDTTSELSHWQPLLQHRYQLIKSLTAKPVVQILNGNNGDQQALSSNLKGNYDSLMVDTYPIGCQGADPDAIQSIKDATTGVASAPAGNWFVVQAFSWADSGGCGSNHSQYHVPTDDQMTQMANLALGNSFGSVMLYPVTDSGNNETPIAALKPVVAALRAAG